jgi:flagellin-like hook-associated protein FlgL
MAKYRKLGRTSAQRKALLRNQVTNLLYHGKIRTTETKAKEVRKIAEHLITLAIREKDNFTVEKVKVKVPRKDKDGKRIKEEKDGKKVDVSADDAVKKYHYGLNDNGSIVQIKGADIMSKDADGKIPNKEGKALVTAGSILPIGGGTGKDAVGGFISVKTKTAARAAMDNIAAAIKLVSARRSKLGAVQNRLEHTIKNLDNVVENTTAAESQIRDTDMASEMVKYSNNNILMQAGQSMLAQANQSNQGVLSLLG